MSSKKSRSRTPRQQPRRPQRTANSQYVTKKQMSGGRFTPPTNPPDVTYMPWHPVTLVIAHSDTLDFQVKSVTSYLRYQLDPTNRGFNQTKTGDTRFVVQFRLMSIAAWNLTGRVVSLSIDDFMDSEADKGARDQICGLVDTGTSTHTPCVGFTLSHAHQQHVLRTDDKQDDMYLFSVTGSAGQFVTYVKILYRFDGPAKHPKILSPTQEIEKVVTNISNKILKMKEPSTLELTLNGVKYVAEAVALIGSVGDVPKIEDRMSVLHIDDNVAIKRRHSEQSEEHSVSFLDTDESDYPDPYKEIV